MGDAPDNSLETLNERFAAAAERLQTTKDCTEQVEIIRELRGLLKQVPTENMSAAQQKALADKDETLRSAEQLLSLSDPGLLETFDSAVSSIATVGADPYVLMFLAGAALAIAKAGASFLEGFGQKLGELVAQRMVDRLSRIRVHDGPTQTVVEVEESPVRFEMDRRERIPDEAWLALLSMDLSEPSLKGRTLRWNSTEQSWKPTEELPQAKEPS